VHDQRVLAVLVRTYGPWPGSGFNVTIRLDARGGHRVDAQLQMFSGQDVGCILQRPHGSTVAGFRLHGDRAVCRVPMQLLKPTKRIRWKVIARDARFHHPDFAPNDRGWYD
jgi:hypothetical protein